MKMVHHDSQLKSRKTVGENRQSIGVFRGKRKGLTLIEVVISLAIFSLLAIPVAGFINTSVKMNKKAEFKQQATLLGQSILEELGSVEGLIVGANALFGKEDVLVLSNDSCNGSHYCVRGLELEEMLVDLDFKKLENQSYQTPHFLNDESEEVNLFIEVSNSSIIGQVSGELPKIVDKENHDILTVFIDEFNKVSLIASSNNGADQPVYLDGELSNGNIMINMKTNNQNHAIKNINIYNNGKFKLQGCLDNKDAEGHISVTQVNVLPREKGNIKILAEDEVCAFNSSEIQPDEGEDTGELPSNPPSQVTETLDLYEVGLTIYTANSELLLFNGSRVLPFKFNEED